MILDTPTPFPGVAMADLTLDEAVAAVARRAREPTFSYVVTPNVDHIVALRRGRHDPRARAFRQAYAEAGLVLCDSRVLASLARRAGRTLAVVPGSDLTVALFERGVLDGLVVAIVGGHPGSVTTLAARFPGPTYRHLQPPMGVLSDPTAQAAIVDFVAASGAQVTLFAFGSPQSEIVASACARSGRGRGVGLCIGASIEFIVGAKRRAPRWMRRAGLEWLHRLLSEPRRLWRRYLVEGPAIFAIWWHDRRRRG